MCPVVEPDAFLASKSPKVNFMRKLSLLLIVLLDAISFSYAQVQSDPAHWAYGLKKLTGNMYEVHLKCTIDEGWHVYAQKQGNDFIGTRTKITLDKTPGLKIIGLPTEIGKKDVYTAKEVGITNYEYAGKVDFVQKVSIKPSLREIKGTITYQTCTHKQCLVEKTINFIVPVPSN